MYICIHIYPIYSRYIYIRYIFHIHTYIPNVSQILYIYRYPIHCHRLQDLVVLQAVQGVICLYQHLQVDNIGKPSGSLVKQRKTIKFNHKT